MNQENLKNKLSEKDEKKRIFNEELEKIKEHYKVNFKIEFFKNNDIDKVIFLDLSYKKKAEEITLIYNNRIGKFNFISYKMDQNYTNKSLIDKVIISTLNKEKRLNLVIAELLRLVKEYKLELEKIDKKYKKREERKNLKN